MLVFRLPGSDRVSHRTRPETTGIGRRPLRGVCDLFYCHEQDLRRFIRSLLPTWTDTDEVVQQTAIVIWRKFDQFDPETNFMKWACVIARFEALAYRRKMARDRHVFREEVLELMADEAIEPGSGSIFPASSRLLPLPAGRELTASIANSMRCLWAMVMKQASLTGK